MYSSTGPQASVPVTVYDCDMLSGSMIFSGGIEAVLSTKTFLQFITSIHGNNHDV